MNNLLHYHLSLKKGTVLVLSKSTQLLLEEKTPQLLLLMKCISVAKSGNLLPSLLGNFFQVLNFLLATLDFTVSGKDVFYLQQKVEFGTSF